MSDSTRKKDYAVVTVRVPRGLHSACRKLFADRDEGFQSLLLGFLLQWSLGQELNHTDPPTNGTVSEAYSGDNMAGFLEIEVARKWVSQLANILEEMRAQVGSGVSREVQADPAHGERVQSEAEARFDQHRDAASEAIKAFHDDATARGVRPATGHAKPNPARKKRTVGDAKRVPPGEERMA